jgi:hypothetical protein
VAVRRRRRRKSRRRRRKRRTRRKRTRSRSRSKEEQGGARRDGRTDGGTVRGVDGRLLVVYVAIKTPLHAK